MNAPISHPQNSNSVTPTTSGLSAGLRTLLELEPSTPRAIAEIAAVPALLAEARRALPSLEALAKAQAGDAGVQQVLYRRFPLFPQPERTDEEWSAWWQDYYDALADVPLGSLEAAMAAYVKQADAEFMPKPGQLLALARTIPARPIRAYERAQAAVKAADSAAPRVNAPQTIDPPKVRPMPTEHDRAAVQRMRAAYDAQVDARAKPNTPDRPPIHGATDETGITSQMREYLARRSEG